jgi:HK97 family phage major capsid protein
MTRHETPLTGLRGKGVSISPKGMNLLRLKIAKALHPGNETAAARYAAKQWGASSSVAMQLKADKPGGITSSGWADDFVQTSADSVAFFGAVIARSVLGQLTGARKVPFHTAALGISAGTGVGWVKEGFSSPGTNPVTYRVAGLESFKLMANVPISNTLLRDSDPSVEEALRQDLLNSAAYALNQAFCDPSNAGVALTKPASVFYGQGSSDSPAETHVDTGDIVEGLIANQDFAGDLEKSVILMHPATAARMTSAARPDIGVRGGTLSGFPVAVNSGCPTNFVGLIDPTALLYADGGGEINTSENGTLELTDVPVGEVITPTASTQISLYQDNMTAFQVIHRSNFAMGKPNCASYVNIAVG